MTEARLIPYKKVIPRDLFNDAKLLKCLGLLSLKVHDGDVPCEIIIEAPEDEFKIGLYDDGTLEVTNMHITVNGTPRSFRTTYNNKNNYPLLMEINGEEIHVFTEDGSWSDEFIKTVKNEC